MKTIFILSVLAFFSFNLKAQTNLGGGIKQGKIISRQLYLNNQETPVYLMQDLSSGKIMKAQLNETNVNEGVVVVYIEDTSKKCDRGNEAQSAPNQAAEQAQANQEANAAQQTYNQIRANIVGQACALVGAIVAGLN